MSRKRGREGHRVRADGELMEGYVFTMGPDGKATRYTVHNNHYTRVH